MLSIRSTSMFLSSPAPIACTLPKGIFANFFRNELHWHVEDVFSVQKHFAAQISRKKLRDQPVYQTGQRGFAASAASAKQHALSVRNAQIDILRLPPSFPEYEKETFLNSIIYIPLLAQSSAAKNKASSKTAA